MHNNLFIHVHSPFCGNTFVNDARAGNVTSASRRSAPCCLPRLSAAVAAVHAGAQLLSRLVGAASQHGAKDFTRGFFTQPYYICIYNLLHSIHRSLSLSLFLLFYLFFYSVLLCFVLNSLRLVFFFSLFSLSFFSSAPSFPMYTYYSFSSPHHLLLLLLFLFVLPNKLLFYL